MMSSMATVIKDDSVIMNGNDATLSIDAKRQEILSQESTATSHHQRESQASRIQKLMHVSNGYAIACEKGLA